MRRVQEQKQKEVGVDEEKLEDADDEDDVKGTVIGLILEQPSATAAEPPPETQREEELQKLREELGGMKVKALKKRAKEAEVDEEKLEDADDADDVKGTIIDLIVAKEHGGPPAAAVVKPHFSATDSGGSNAAHFKNLFGDKHCMFSYNWAVQEDIKAARSEVGAAGVPTWMDIDGRLSCASSRVFFLGVTCPFCGAQAG